MENQYEFRSLIFCLKENSNKNQFSCGLHFFLMHTKLILKNYIKEYCFVMLSTKLHFIFNQRSYLSYTPSCAFTWSMLSTLILFILLFKTPSFILLGTLCQHLHMCKPSVKHNHVRSDGISRPLCERNYAVFKAVGQSAAECLVAAFSNTI